MAQCEAMCKVPVEVRLEERCHLPGARLKGGVKCGWTQSASHQLERWSILVFISFIHPRWRRILSVHYQRTNSCNGFQKSVFQLASNNNASNRTHLSEPFTCNLIREEACCWRFAQGIFVLFVTVPMPFVSLSRSRNRMIQL